MTEYDRIFARLQELLGEEFGWDPEEIGEETDFVDDLGADSLDITELNFMLEEEFDTTPEDAQAMASLETVGELCAYLADRGE